MHFVSSKQIKKRKNSIYFDKREVRKVKMAILVGLIMLVSVAVFGISFGVGGGANVPGIVGLPLFTNALLYALSGNIVLPLSNQIALTGNFEYLTPTSLENLEGFSGSLFLLAGGIRYTYGLPTDAVRTFIGLDGGMLSGLLSISQTTPYYASLQIGNDIVVGPNIGMTIQMTKMLLVYIEGTARMVVGSIGTGLSFDDLNVGLNFNL